MAGRAGDDRADLRPAHHRGLRPFPRPRPGAPAATLPVGGKVPQTPSPNDEERDGLLAEFLESDEVVGLTGVGDGDSEDTTVEELADQLLTFSLDYALGTPLRFSPVMVEIFCLDWAPRKIALDGDAFTLLPDVLAAWIRFVGRRRAIPERSIRASVDATYEFAPEMIELSQDPEVWGPAKTMALALQQRGIDMSDQAAAGRLRRRGEPKRRDRCPR